MTADVVSLDPGDHKPLSQIVGARIRGQMAEQSRTQAELATVLNKSQQTVSKHLRGKVPIDLNELATIAGWLGLEIEELLPPQRDGRTTITRMTSDRGAIVIPFPRRRAA